MIIDLSEEMQAKIKEDRRLACFQIHPEFLPLLFRQGEGYRVVKGVPADAVLVKLGLTDYTERTFLLWFWSSSFDSLPQGATCPPRDIVFERVLPAPVAFDDTKTIYPPR